MPCHPQSVVSLFKFKINRFHYAATMGQMNRRVTQNVELMAVEGIANIIYNWRQKETKQVCLANLPTMLPQLVAFEDFSL